MLYVLIKLLGFIKSFIIPVPWLNDGLFGLRCSLSCKVIEGCYFTFTSRITVLSTLKFKVGFRNPVPITIVGFNNAVLDSFGVNWLVI